MKNDTLTSFIRAECANLVKENQCLGLKTNNKRFMNPGKCLILAKRRCDYFKKCVLPLARLKGCYDRVFNEYLKLDKSLDQSEGARLCDCGNELKPRERFCERCRWKKRQKTNRENLQKYRGST